MLPPTNRSYGIAAGFVSGLNAPMPVLTRRADPHRADCWLIHYGDVRVGSVARAAGTPNAQTQWKCLIGFYPGPGDQRGGTADTFEAARAAFEAAWQNIAARAAALIEKFNAAGISVSPHHTAMLCRFEAV
jgi:hypothetical protein